ncbi:hypothetical protein GCE86_30190 [Micromonospora terminaliae]|uniref:DUF2306 domain-containing protein n=1 Tax=Micromonospora terminaliae TaxID=1914461 RepID=A0AAJ2ZCB7_9ACTN|nr:hypothetical protein [Micromonospora terminaliae]NES26771.1 hypothetical protein [Micromonospora terminaliae]QGL50926.1 hypothetical protein GCE86_30190 [Micromonospora terminaliae]
MHTVLVVIHAASGTIGLLLALPVLLAPKRRGRHTLLGRVYAGATVGLSLSAFGLFAYDPAHLWGLAVLGALTLGWLVGGLWFARRRPRGFGPRGWRIWHLNLMGSTVIAFVTGFAVQMSGGHLAAWLTPTVLGSLLIARTTAREVARAPRRVAVATTS